MDISNFVVLVEVNTQKYCAVSLELSQNSAVYAKNILEREKQDSRIGLASTPSTTVQKLKWKKGKSLVGPFPLMSVSDFNPRLSFFLLLSFFSRRPVLPVFQNSEYINSFIF